MVEPQRLPTRLRAVKRSYRSLLLPLKRGVSTQKKGVSRHVWFGSEGDSRYSRALASLIAIGQRILRLDNFLVEIQVEFSGLKPQSETVGCCSNQVVGSLAGLEVGRGVEPFLASSAGVCGGAGFLCAWKATEGLGLKVCCEDKYRGPSESIMMSTCLISRRNHTLQSRNQ